MRRGKGEGWVLGALLLVFVVAAVYYGERGFQSQQSDQPTTYSVGPGGLKALYQLYDRVGLRTQRFERPLTKLPHDAGLLVIVEPLRRKLEKEETAALWRWVDRGGSVLIVAAAAWSRRSKDAFTVPDASIELVPYRVSDVDTDTSPEPMLRDVRHLHVAGRTRLKSLDKESGIAVAADALGACVVRSTNEAGGAITVVADSLGPSNNLLATGDNAILFVNLASSLPRGRSTILFDEYHQGFGSEEAGGRSLWQALGQPARTAFLFAVVLLAVGLYNANRRFGTALRLAPPSSRPSTDYLSSMAGLLRRAGAPELAVETTYRAFIRDLARLVDAAPDASPLQVAERAARHLGWDPGVVTPLITRCEQIVQGAHAPENEALKLARQLRRLRTQAQLGLVGPRPGA